MTMEKVIGYLENILERLKSRTRDADKQEFRNSIHASAERSASAESNKNYWIKKGWTVNITSRFDDDEPNKEAKFAKMLDAIEEVLDQRELQFNQKYLGKKGYITKGGTQTQPPKKDVPKKWGT